MKGAAQMNAGTAACPLCGSPSHPVLRDRPDYEYGHAIRLDYHRCDASGCGFVFAAPIPVEAIPGFYSDYSTHAAPDARTPPGRVQRALARLLPPVIARDRERYDGAWIPADPSLRILDFGCGNGRLLKRLGMRGFKHLEGFDADPKARAAAGAQGFEIHHDLDELSSSGRQFDVIVLNHVVEHLDRPVEVLQQLVSLLAADGVLYLRTPNTASLLSRAFGSTWRGYETPRHLHLFNARNIRHLVGRLPGVSAKIRTENALLQGMFHESLVAPFWRSAPGRGLRHAAFPLVAWICVGLHAVGRTVGEELVVELRKDEAHPAAAAVPRAGS